MTELEFYKKLDGKLWRIKRGELSLDDYIREVAQKMIKLSTPPKIEIPEETKPSLYGPLKDE
jgi:hypothetical protein